ncbi:IclR family transcriptional regulator [Streptomyces sp. SDr-06]|uniref:IclR family transcriptional regulator n=1 Tax=Streptomyces sp. SDr-06 TaxID=2267702 RepID=UPI000DE83DAB|nr:helix-turn-helix domain-containing protein [Streptomyces sp. SDr-06]RCH64459.1 IclR family transcriptional regulator [Streptomyces sp. SDr-06]
MAGSAADFAGERPSRGRGVLEGAFALLDALKEAEEAGLTALSAGAGLPKATAYRLLEQLAELGAVEHRGCRYRMGPRMFRLGLGWQPHPRLRAAANTPIRKLAAATDASVAICVVREGRTLAAFGVPGIVDHLAPVRPGASWPWTTAAGKLLVAFAPPEAPLSHLPATWTREASAIREKQVCLDREELIPGVCCAAAPVTTPHGDIVGAVCAMAAPSHDITKLANAVQRAGRMVSAGLRQP